MSTHSSAQARQETPHATNSTTNNTISDAVRRRAHALINDRTIDASERVWIRYALETNDASGLAELVRRADAAEMICPPGDPPETRAAALLVLMSTLENSTEPKVLANHVKHLAFTRCGELKRFGMVDSQIATIERELLETLAD